VERFSFAELERSSFFQNLLLQYMKQFTLLLLLAFMSLSGHAQKEDFIWYLGYLPNAPEQKFGGTRIDFQQSPPSVTFFNLALEFTPVSMISNAEGDVLYYSGGCSIANRNNQIMPNGGSINSGQYADIFCPVQGYPTFSGIISLPFPGDTFRYLFFHLWKDMSSLYKRLLTSHINMALDQGLGDVESKNEIILQDTFAGYLTAVRHGNGRDWWVAAHKGRSNRSLLFMLDPDGLHAPIAQHIGPVWGPRDWSGQSVFSPDGSKYARANPDNGLNLFDFDRCTGAFSNPIVVSLAADSASATGVAFSPNSRFLYLSTGLKLFQFDMQAPNIPASKQLIGVYDGFLGPFPTTFYQMRLAPNGKIYMGATNGVNFLHVIHQPDLSGQACDFVQHDMELPTYSDVGLPNFPYFRLYDEPGSPCDTLGINGGPWWTSTGAAAEGQVGVMVAPNPATDRISLRFANAYAGVVAILDTHGRILRSETVAASANEPIPLIVSDLPNGVYFLQTRDHATQSVLQKVVIAR
jgi:hypothetical protein